MGCSGTPPISKYSLKHNIIHHTTDVSSIIELPSGNILTAGAHGMLYIWNKSYTEIIETVRAHYKHIPDLLLYEPRLFISISEECMIRIWKIGKKIKICGELELNYIPLIIRKINNKCISTGSSLGIKLYSFKNNNNTYFMEEINFLPQNSPVIAINVINDGRIAINSLYQVLLWDYIRFNKDEYEKSVTYLKAHRKSVSSLLVLNNGFLVSGGEDKKLIIWNTKKKEIIKELNEHKGPILSLYQLKEGNLVSGDKYSLIYIWNLDFSGIYQTLIEDGAIFKFYQLKTFELCSISSCSEIKIWGHDS